MIIHVRIHHCSTITNSGIYKSTSGGTVIQNMYSISTHAGSSKYHMCMQSLSRVGL